MPTFTYRALQTDGKVAEGQIDAGGRSEAFRLIENLSLRPISLKEGANGRPKTSTPKPVVATPKDKVSSQRIINFRIVAK